MKRIPIIISFILLSGCSSHQAAPNVQNSERIETSRFHDLELNVGMNREQVEMMVHTLLGQPKKYNPYGNNLQGGTVQYRDGDWILEVIYKAGAPAPWVQKPEGGLEHHPPVDETVLEYHIKKS